MGILETDDGLLLTFSWVLVPQETNLELPVSVPESLLEAWVGGGLMQGQGQCMW